MKKKRSKVWPVAALIILVGGAGYAAVGTDMFRAEEEDQLEGAEVQSGSLRISVVERGNLKAADSVTLKSEIEGRTTVLYLIEEGKQVEEGELLCELDTSELVDQRVQQEINVQNAFASYSKAQQNYEIQESQNTSDIARGEQTVDFARMDLAKYLEGERPQDLAKADEDILLRDEELQRALQELEWSEKLAEKGFLEQTQLDADRLVKTSAQIALTQANRAKELLVQYEIPRNEKEFESNVEESLRELERIKLQAKAYIADYDAALKTSKAKYDLEKSELEKLVDQIGKAKIHAPVAGMVVYSVEDRGRWGGGEPMQEGSEVRERQEIITMPSEKGYIAEASLHESVLESVTIGMPCFVTVDALQVNLRAEVTFKAVLPDQQSWFANPDLRVYRTEIAILDEEPRMRPGMSCSIEILVDDLENATYVPVQSVFLNAGAPTALVIENGAVEKRPIEVGQNNGKWVEIKSGLEPGQVVALSLPEGTTLDPAVDAPDLEDRKDWPESKAPRTTPAEGGGQPGGAPAASLTAAGSEKPAAAGAGGGMDPAKFEQWKKDNPEAAKRIEEAMKDPEKMRQMREQYQGGGGSGRPGGGGRSGGGGRPGGAGSQ